MLQQSGRCGPSPTHFPSLPARELFFKRGGKKKPQGKEKQTHLAPLLSNLTIVWFLVSRYFAWTAQPGVFGLLRRVSIVA